MLLEFSVIPVGTGTHVSDQVAAVVAVVDASGLPYQLTASGTTVEGEWDEVMDLLRRCRDELRKSTSRAVWLIKIDDEPGRRDKLTRHVISVEERLGRTVHKTAEP